MGYPDVVKFSDNGGVETISVEDARPFFSITIIDYNTAGEGMYYSNEGSGGYCEYEWLRVETEADNSTLMRVIAQPILRANLELCGLSYTLVISIM